MQDEKNTGKDNTTADTSNKQGELLQLQTSAPEKESNVDYSRTWEPISKTPFVYVQTEEGNEFLAMGNKRVTDYSDKIELMRMVNERDWDLILNAVVVIVSDMEKKGMTE